MHLGSSTRLEDFGAPWVLAPVLFGYGGVCCLFFVKRIKGNVTTDIGSQKSSMKTWEIFEISNNFREKVKPLLLSEISAVPKFLL